MAIHTFSNWNARNTDSVEQIEPYRKYYFICEGANTETFYFEYLIGLRKKLNIHPLIDIRLLERTDEDRNNSAPKRLVQYAKDQKCVLSSSGEYDSDRDRMVIVFDADIYETQAGYSEILAEAETGNIVGITNPAFELFLLLHLDNAYERYIKGNDKKYFEKDAKGSLSYAKNILSQQTHINPKKNRFIGELAENVLQAIEEEKKINQDIHKVKGIVTSNIGQIIEAIINEKID